MILTGCTGCQEKAAQINALKAETARQVMRVQIEHARYAAAQATRDEFVQQRDQLQRSVRAMREALYAIQALGQHPTASLASSALTEEWGP